MQNWLKDKEKFKTILKVIGIIVGLQIIGGVIEAFIPEDNLKLWSVTLLLPAILILVYAYFMAKKEDYFGLKVIFVVLLVDEIIQIVGRVL